VRLQRLLAMPVVGTKEKLILYGGTIAFQWVLAGAVAWRAFARGLTLSDLGLAKPMNVGLLVLSFVGAVLLGVFQSFNLRRVGRMTGPIPDFMRKLAERVLPNGKVELPPYFALAITAGICEEIVYRGFAMAALTRLGIYSWAVLLLTSVLFGLAHTYQGRSGVVGTGLMGLLLGGTRILCGSLIPVMVWHAAVDLAAGIMGPKYLLRSFELP
jgi:uncharacterized protein